nr:hypothetical protein [Lachnospiraceae bacterium]
MKRMISVIAAVMLAIGLTACGNNEEQAAEDTAQMIQAESSQEAEQIVTNESVSDTTDEIAEDTSSGETGSTNEEGGILVVYFSATGNTKGVAE